MKRVAKKAGLLIIIFFLIMPLYSQGVYYFDTLYNYYNDYYLKKISDFKIKYIETSLNSFYDSNFFMSPTLKREEEGINYTIFLRGAYLRSERLIIETLGSLNYQTYHNNTDFNYLNRDYLINILYKFRRFLLWGSIKNEKRRARIYSWSGDLYTYSRSSYGLKLNYETPRRTFFELEANSSSFRVKGNEEESIISEIMDRDENSLKFTFNYKIFKKSFFNFSIANFKRRMIYSERRNSDEIKILAGLNIPDFGILEQRVGGKILLGFDSFKLNYFDKKYNTWIFDVDFKISFYRFKLYFKGLREFNYNLWLYSPVFLSTMASAETSYYFSRAFYLTSSVVLRKLEYKEPFIIDWERLFVKPSWLAFNGGLHFKTLKGYEFFVNLSYGGWDSEYFYYFQDNNKFYLSTGLKKRFGRR